MTVENAIGVGPSRIDLAYERLGDPAHPPVVLVMGFGMQMLGWPDGFCDALVGHGLQVIRFDNRDVGLSTHLTHAQIPNLGAALSGDSSSVSYRLVDMAADTVGLLDALRLDSAHVVGCSMGGFIAQTMAIESPMRVRTLTSIMSSTGDLSVGQPTPAARALFLRPPIKTRAEVVARAIETARVIGSPGYPTDDTTLAERAGAAYDRNFDLLAAARQGLAVIASGDRTARLRELRVPTLVIHGEDDPLVTVSGGRATAAAIPGAQLEVIPGMGHDLPRGLWPHLTSRIAAFILAAAAVGACSSKADAPAAEVGAKPAAVDLPSSQAVTKFWTWFAQNAETLRADKDLQHVMESVSGELAKVAPGVFAEIGADGNARTLVLSVNGKQALFATVEQLVALRPSVPQWTIVGFRQRAKPGSPALQIKLGDVTIDPGAVRFVSTRNGAKLDLEVFLPGAMTDQQRGEIGFVMLDHTVGEYDMETKIGGIEFAPIEKAPATATPLRELPAQVDALN